MVVEDENEHILRELIEAVDLDTSVFINENELAAVCDLDKNDLKEIFQQLDIDRDGKISVEDFILNYKKFQLVAKEKNTHVKLKSATKSASKSAAKASGKSPGKVAAKSSSDTPSKSTPSKKNEEKERSSDAIRKTAEFYLG